MKHWTSTVPPIIWWAFYRIGMEEGGYLSIQPRAWVWMLTSVFWLPIVMLAAGFFVIGMAILSCKKQTSTLKWRNQTKQIDFKIRIELTKRLAKSMWD